MVSNVNMIRISVVFLVLLCCRTDADPVQNSTWKVISDLGTSRTPTLTTTIKFSFPAPQPFVFNEGDTPTLTCFGMGNPIPNLTLTRKKTMKELASLRGNLMTTKLTHRMDPLGYLDTGVYFCTGENYLGVTTQEINIGVRCPPQQIWQTTQHKAMLGQTSTVSLPVYSYPAPHELSLQRATDNRNLTGSPRHSVQFSSSYEPFGLVNITISDVVKEDFANYSISIDNGEGEALVLNFSIHEGSQGRRNSETIPKVVYQSDFGDKEEAITTV